MHWTRPFWILNIAKSLTTSLLVAMLFVSCGGKEPVDPTPPTPIETKDTKAPVISVSQASVNVIGGRTVTLGTSELKIGDKTVATWTDNVSKTCKSALEFNGQTISSGSKLSEPGKLKLSVTDGAGNTATAGITLTNEDSQAPQISVAISEKNVIAGVKVSIQDNQLLFDDAVAATWADDYSTACKAELSLLPEGSTTARAINPGDKLSEAGTLKLMIADDFNNIATASIKLTAIAIYGLENLQNLSLQVEKEVNLLQGLTFADGVSLSKAEIEVDGVRSEIPDPTHYLPEYPGTINVILTHKIGEKIDEVKVTGLKIEAMSYSSPDLAQADVLNERYRWYYNLPEKKQDFIYPHILISYASEERYKMDNLEFIITTELPLEYECESVWFENVNEHTAHADWCYVRIRSLSPNGTIKGCWGTWNYMESYVIQHPERIILASCSSGNLADTEKDGLFRDSNYASFKSILKNEHVVMSVAGGNVTSTWNVTLNENEEPQEMGIYTDASVNSMINNKISVVGFDPARDNIFLYDEESRLPKGKGFWTIGNLVIPFITGVSKAGKEDQTTKTSFATAMLCATCGNHISILMNNHPWITATGAMSLMTDNYFIADTFKYKDPEDGVIKDGGTWYFFNTEKFLKEEVLHRTEVEAALDGSPQSLPSMGGLCYEGKGIQFSCGGQTYDMIEDNRSVLENAVKSGQEIQWTYSPDRARKFGVSGNNTVTVRVMDKQARFIPDITLSAQVK